MKMLMTAMAVVGLVLPASAADLGSVTKAPAYPTTRCGGYIGMNGEGMAASVAGATPGTISAGGNIGVLVGYACPNAIFPWFVEALADWQNMGAGNGLLSFKAPFHGEARGGIQTDFLQLIPQILPGTGAISGLPSSAPPVLPPGAVANGPTVNYVYAALDFDDVSAQFGGATARDWMFSPEIGTGILAPVKLANGKPIVLDAWVGAEMQTNSICIGGIVCPKLETRWKVGTAIKF